MVLTTLDVKEDLQQYYKYIPAAGILALLWLSSKDDGNGLFSALNTEKLPSTIAEATILLQNSINLSDQTAVMITAITVVTIWTGYKYWLSELRVVRRNTDLLEKLVFVLIFAVIVDRHIVMTSAIGHYVDWALFFAVVYLELAGTWFLAKTIDQLDLSSDLYCWGLRLLGVATMGFGGILFLSSALTLELSNTNLVFDNVYWILSICLMFLGAFMDYRSFRRHPAIHIW